MDQENEVEDERVKSALEIAMERLSGLPELTAEDIAEQREKEYRPVGEALANKFLQGIMDEESLPEEISRYKEDSGRIVIRALISYFCRSIQLDDLSTTVKALGGLCLLAGGREGIQEKANAAWARILDDFQQRKKRTIQAYEVSEREKLVSLGISGSAVRPNLTENESLNKDLDDLRASLEPEVEKLRAMFLQNLRPE